MNMKYYIHDVCVHPYIYTRKTEFFKTLVLYKDPVISSFLRLAPFPAPPTTLAPSVAISSVMVPCCALGSTIASNLSNAFSSLRTDLFSVPFPKNLFDGMGSNLISWLH